MRNQFLAFMIFCLIANTWGAHAQGVGGPTPPYECDQVLNVADLDLAPDIIAATQEYVANSKRIESEGFKRYLLRRILNWVNPISYIRYFRGESQPDASTFRIYRKQVTVDGEEKEQVIFVVGLPQIMKKKDRQQLEKLASNFKRFGIPKIDPRVERKEFSWRYFNDEFGFFTGLSLLFANKTMKVWDFTSRELPRWVLIHSLPLPLPMLPSSWRPYQLPLHEDLKHFKIKVVNERGETSYRKIKMDPRAGELIYLLNMHRPNVVEAMDRIGGDVRVILAMTFIYSAISDVIRTIDSGVNQISEYGTIMPVVAVASSRLIAAFLNALQDGKIPKLNPHNVYLAAKKVRFALRDLIISMLRKEVEEPSTSAEQLFDRYKWTVEKDDYWESSIVAFFGYEPIRRDKAVIFETKAMGNAIRGIGDRSRTAEFEAIVSAQKLARTLGAPGASIVLDTNGGNISQPGDSASGRVLHIGADETISHRFPDQYSNEPMFIMVPRSHVSGMHHQLTENLGYTHVLP